MSAILLVLATLFVPQGSIKQIEQNPLDKGEVAYIQENDTEATAYIGSDGQQSLNVVDKTALRGYAYKYLERDKFVVLAVSNLTWDASNGWFINENCTTNTVLEFKFEIPNDVLFEDVEFETWAKNTSGMGGANLYIISKIREGNRVTIKAKDRVYHSYEAKIWGFKVKILDYGDPNHVTDLTTHKFFFKDFLGSQEGIRSDGFDLSMLRFWTKHLYDGNRGEDWAKYKAASNVEMGQYDLQIGKSNRGIKQFTIGTDEANTNHVVTLLDGEESVRYYRDEGESYPNGVIAFSAINVGTDTITLTVTNANIASFTANKIKLFYTDKYGKHESKWHKVPCTATVSGNTATLTVSKIYDSGFYQVRYGTARTICEISNLRAKNLEVWKNGAWVNIDDVYLTEETADYTLKTLTDSDCKMKSGQIGNYSTATNITVTLDFTTAANRAGDCMLYVINTDTANDRYISVAPNTLDIVTTADNPLKIAKATTNIVMFSRVKANTILTSKQEVK